MAGYWPGAGRMPQHGAETAGVMQQKARVGENPFGMIVFASRFIHWYAAQRPGHSKVNDLGAVVEADQYVFAATTALAHDPTAQCGGHVCGSRPSHARIVHEERFEPAVCHNRCNAATRGLDLRKFRHNGVLLSFLDLYK